MAVFPKKDSGSSKFHKNLYFFGLFRTSLKNLSNDFVENGKIRFERYYFRCGTITADNGHIGWAIKIFLNFFFCSKSLNGQIYGNKWFLEIFIFFLHIGHLASRLCHFSTIFENEVLVDFFDFGRLDILDIAYSDSTNCSRPLYNQ